MDKRQNFTIQPIGLIHTPFTEVKNTPIQPFAAKGIRGWLDIDDEFTDGLVDVSGFSHITLLYLFHRITEHALRVVPFMDTVERGIFATKAPKRPNRLGISTVKLLGIIGNRVEIEEVDMLDGSPLIDIKPFYPRYDNRENVKIGWLEKNRDYPVEKMRADDRFSK
ncbi:MAG: tRNA (N6-threonylcarbamoyladenosine(37)-N6)-methyltransferase TrmO [Desulfobulbaceae bacterium]|jgi:tRNA-Thr(GGU) m(6)t(6)A37 methyltransferase TsaA|nr:tRNA (N6-threonylcarbamoyladenosine(37)-N6)-methyltransferase TrmO [Desulfobulbaceae bacterium]